MYWDELSRAPPMKRHDRVALATLWWRNNVTAVPSDTAEKLRYRRR